MALQEANIYMVLNKIYNEDCIQGMNRLYANSCDYAIWATKGKGWTFNRQRETYENAIFEYPVVHHSKRIHPTQKPVELIEDIIKIHSNEGDIILDPFMGSGSTAIACLNTNRRYLGFELDSNYFKESNKRIMSFISLF